MTARRLTASERRLVEATSHGEPLDLVAGDEPADGVGGSASWLPERCVRAEVFTDLLTGRLGHETTYPITLAGARVTGTVNLVGVRVVRPMYLLGCAFTDTPRLTDAETKTLSFTRCLLPGLQCSHARIDGSLVCAGSTLTGVLNAAGAQVDGVLDLRGASIRNAEGPALDAQTVRIGGSAYLRDEFYAGGEVRLTGAHIGCNLEVTEARLESSGEGALTANLLTVRQDVYLTASAFEGKVTLTKASIGGGLYLRESHLRNPGGHALAGRWLAVGRDLTAPATTVTGELRLVDANIEGSLDLGGAVLRNPSGVCLNAYGITVGGSVYCGRMADDAVPGGCVDRDAEIEGRIDLSDARVDGHVDFRHTVLRSCPQGESLHLARLRAVQLRLQPATKPPGAVNLVNAHVSQYYDDPVTWPDVVRLRGFEYDVLDDDRAKVRERIHRWLQGRDRDRLPVLDRIRRWLRPRDDVNYLPGVYDQLAAAYRRAGRVQATKMVGLAKLRHRRRALHPVPRLISCVIDITVGYGYRKRWAVLWFVGLSAVGTLAYWLLDRAHDLIAVGPHPPAFNPFAYAVDVIVPIVDLGQQRYWLPQGPAVYCTLLLSLAGWVLLTLVATGMANILKRD